MSKRLLGFMLSMAAFGGAMYKDLSSIKYENINNKSYPPLKGKTGISKARRQAKKRRNKKR